MIRGPDVSSYQRAIDWALVRTESEFAIVKVTDGNAGENKLAEAQVQGAVNAGLLVMLYHYAEPSGPNWEGDAAQEGKRLDDVADRFEQKLGRKFFTFVDVERNAPLTAQERPLWRSWANAFRKWCRDEGKRTIGFYSGRNFTMDLGLDVSWRDTVLWVAQYPAVYRPAGDYELWPKGIQPWMRGDIWQDGAGEPPSSGGNSATCAGIGLSDMNHFAGTRAELEELIASAV